MKIPRNKFQNLIRAMALAAILVLATNCEEESTVEANVQTENQEPGLVLKHYSIKDIQDNTDIVSKLGELNDKLHKNKLKERSSKSVYNNQYDFTIYTDAATYIENGDYHSYTFPLIQEPDEKMANVLFELNDSGGYDAYLVKYDYTTNEFNTLDLTSLSLKTSMEPIDLDFDSLSARTKQAYVCIYTYERRRHDGWVNGSGGNLGGTGTRYSWVLTAGQCETVSYYEEDYREYHQGNTATVTIGGTTYGGSGSSHTSPTPSPFSTEELRKINIVKNRLNLSRSEVAWIDKWENGQYAFKIHDLMAAEMFSDEVLGEAKLTIATLASKVPWSTKTGHYLGRPSLGYKAVRTINVNGTNLSQFLLYNNDVISTGNYRICNGCSESGQRTYYFSRPENLWYEYKVPPVADTAGDLNYLMNTVVWESATFLGRYVLPVEDIVILIDGRDFDGVEQSRVKAAGYILVGFVPGGKAMKPVVKLAKGYTKFSKIVKVGNKSVRLPPMKFVDDIVDFGSENYNRSKLREVLQLAKGSTKHAHHIIPWKFRDFDLIQKAAKSSKTFHISEKLNGIPLPSTNHLTGHAKYNTKVGQILNTLNNGVGINYNEANKRLTGFISYLDNLIRQNPNRNLGQIADFIKYP